MKACLLVNVCCNIFYYITPITFFYYISLGESVPVSKLPITDATLRMLDLTAVNVQPEVSKHFLFCGTRIVRVRKAKSNGVSDNNDDEGVALALVVRTGKLLR
jgi:magnesium-transporting ATPase (P-type)